MVQLNNSAKITVYKMLHAAIRNAIFAYPQDLLKQKRRDYEPRLFACRAL